MSSKRQPRSSGYWVEVLGDAIAHCHLHDNSGETDEHKPVGDGNENWAELFKALEIHSSQAMLVAESDGLENTRLSIERLRSFQ